MVSFAKVNVLDGFEVEGSDVLSAVKWSERAKALFTALAVRKHGLSFEEQWLVMRGGSYRDETDRGALNTDRSRLCRDHGITVETPRSPRRTYLAGVDDTVI